MKTISVIVPAYNEEQNLPNVYAELNNVKGKLSNYKFEFIIIDNCSFDSTRKIAIEICQKDPHWKYVRFSRNFGSEASIAAGYKLSKGDAVIVCFSDLQDPPEVIPQFVTEWEKGYDIVYGVYSGTTHEVFWKRMATKVFYRWMEKMSDPPLLPFAGDFRLVTRRAVNILNQLDEKNRFMRGLSQWVGFKTSVVQYVRRPRIHGKSTASVFHLFNFAFSVIVNFSEKPLRVLTSMGVLICFFSFVMMGLQFYNYFFRPIVPGITSTLVLLTFNLGFTSLGMGILGEYIGKIYREVKNRPLYIVDESNGIGLDDAKSN